MIFAAWFTYGLDGKPLWLVVRAEKTGPNAYLGKLFTASGPPFNVMPFDPARVIATEVGTAGFTFTDGSHATFAYTVNGMAQVEAHHTRGLRSAGHGLRLSRAVTRAAPP